MEWKESYILGHPPVDNTHMEFARQVTALSKTEGGGAARQAIEALIEHSERHFAQENRWMEECGFPPIACHAGEHERVLAWLRGILELPSRGDLGRSLAAELEEWFENHAATMDAMLALYMRHAGYTPSSDPS